MEIDYIRWKWVIFVTNQKYTYNHLLWLDSDTSIHIFNFLIEAIIISSALNGNLILYFAAVCM